jgi:hypothetical protein
MSLERCASLRRQHPMFSASYGPKLAAYTAAWFWAKHDGNNLNAAADNLTLNDNQNFKTKITLKINAKAEAEAKREANWLKAQGVIFDQNAYGNMGEVLKALGFTTQNKKDYNTQFGISLNKPKLQEIDSGANHLLAEPFVQATMLTLPSLEQLQTEFDIQPGETDMLIADMPNIPPQHVPIVIVANATQSSTEELYGSVGVCTVADKISPAEREKQLGVRLYASNIFDYKNPHYSAYYQSIYAHAENKSLLEEAVRNKEIDYRFIRDKNATVTVLEQPEHGKLSQDFLLGVN